MLNGFDLAIVSFINQFSQRSYVFDETVVFMAYSDLLKGGVVVALIWGAWFTGKPKEQPFRRSVILATFLAAFAALSLSRLMAITLPFRPRPIRTPGLAFLIPHGMPSGTDLGEMSAFPSDHAALFFALAAGLFFISRGWGFATTAYVFAAICLPRIYLGLHYPSDILVGTIMGVLASSLAIRNEIVRRGFNERLLSWCERRPAAFYAVSFLITYQIATLFQEARDLGNFGLEILEHLRSRSPVH